jgi:hypothetical protein
MPSGNEAVPHLYGEPVGRDGSAAPARTITATRPGAARRGAGARFCHRFMDAAPSGKGDRAPHGRALSSRLCLEDSEGNAMDLTRAGHPGAGVYPQKVKRWLKEIWPALKKKPKGKRPGSFSRTTAESPNDPRSVEPGRPGGKHRS